MTPAASLLDRLRALPLDRAPLRRAGILAGLLVLLLVAGQWFGPSASGPSVAEARRQNVQPAAEEASAPPMSPWTAGRFAGLLLLVAGGGVAFWLHRRGAPSAPASAASIETLGTQALAGGHALRLVGCGGEVLLLSVGPDGARLLRQWPRDAFDDETEGSTTRFADALAEASALSEDPAPLAEVVSPAEATSPTDFAPPVRAVPDETPPRPLAESEDPPRPENAAFEDEPAESPLVQRPQGGGDGEEYASQDRPVALPQFLSLRG